MPCRLEAELRPKVKKRMPRRALIERGEYQDAEEEVREQSPLRALSRRGFPHFEITEPRQLVVNGDSSAVLADLTRRLASNSAMSRW